MATRPGKIVTVLITRGRFVPQLRRYLRNKKGLRVRGTVLRGSP